MCRGGIVDILEQGCWKMDLLGRRERGKPHRRFMDVIKQDMKRVG